MRTPALLLALLGTGWLAPACGDDDSRVPFDPGVDEENPPGTPTEKPFEPKDGQPLADGTRRVAVEGAPLTVSTGAMRSLLALDADGDGDRDALVLTVSDTGGVAVAYARRDGTSFEALRTLAPLGTETPDCTVVRPSIRTVSRRLGITSVERQCEHGTEQAMALLSLEGEPRVGERVTLLPPEGRSPSEAAIGLRTEDRDDDGYEDVILDVRITTPNAGPPVNLELVWLDRPSGLARDRAEPEATFKALAEEAEKKLASDAAEAEKLARGILGAHATLCRRGEGPRIRFGDMDGLDCGRSAGVGRALAVAAAALLQRGDLFGALEASERLGSDAFEIKPAQQKLVARAWEKANTPKGLRWRKVGTQRRPAGPPVRLPALALVDEKTLILRGETPTRLDLTNQATTPAGAAAGSVLVTDPSGALAVTDVHRTCEGFALTLVRRADVVAGTVAGPPVSEPLLEARPPPPGANCPGPLPPTQKKDTGGYRVLGWAPQGVVAVRRDAVRVVPLTLAGQPAGEPTELERHVPPPAPLPAGASTPDGQAYVLATPHGVVLRRIGGPVILLRPDDWKSAKKDPVGEATLAPNGHTAAVMLGNEVWLLEGF